MGQILTRREKHLAISGDELKAIKSLRNRTALDLRQAKETIEAFVAENITKRDGTDYGIEKITDLTIAAINAAGINGSLALDDFGDVRGSGHPLVALRIVDSDEKTLWWVKVESDSSKGSSMADSINVIIISPFKRGEAHEEKVLVTTLFEFTDDPNRTVIFNPLVITDLPDGSVYCPWDDEA